jgi:hypothetical protein
MSNPMSNHPRPANRTDLEERPPLFAMPHERHSNPAYQIVSSEARGYYILTLLTSVTG